MERDWNALQEERQQRDKRERVEAFEKKQREEQQYERSRKRVKEQKRAGPEESYEQWLIRNNARMLDSDAEFAYNMRQQMANIEEAIRYQVQLMPPHYTIFDDVLNLSTEQQHQYIKLSMMGMANMSEAGQLLETVNDPEVEVNRRMDRYRRLRKQLMQGAAYDPERRALALSELTRYARQELSWSQSKMERRGDLNPTDEDTEEW